jgi:hypothetical protein
MGPVMSSLSRCNRLPVQHVSTIIVDLLLYSRLPVVSSPGYLLLFVVSASTANMMRSEENW